MVISSAPQPSQTPQSAPCQPDFVQPSAKVASFLLFLASTSLAAFPPPSPFQDSLPVGAKLSHFATIWSASSPYLGSLLREGIWIQWVDEVPARFQCANSKFDEKLAYLFDEEVQALQGKKAVSRIPADQAFFVCSLFLVAKKGGDSARASI
jgi:hypothetical protein